MFLRARVQFQLIGSPRDGDASACNAVRVSSDDGTHRGGVGDVVLACLVAEHDVERFSADKALELHQTCAVGRNGDARAVRIRQRVEIDSITARHRAERLHL